MCLLPGPHTLVLQDAFGDGWNGGTIGITMNDADSTVIVPNQTLPDDASSDYGKATSISFTVVECSDCQSVATGKG